MERTYATIYMGSIPSTKTQNKNRIAKIVPYRASRFCDMPFSLGLWVVCLSCCVCQHMQSVKPSCYYLRMEDYPCLSQAISSVLAQLREEAGLSKRKLAGLASIDRVYLLQIEQGKYRPTLNSLFFLAEALGISASELVARIEQEQRKLCNLAQMR